MARSAGGYKGWERRCHGRQGDECRNHRGVRLGATGICPIDSLEAQAAITGPNGEWAEKELARLGWQR